jgi:hypothetical protein
MKGYKIYCLRISNSYLYISHQDYPLNENVFNIYYSVCCSNDVGKLPQMDGLLHYSFFKDTNIDNVLKRCGPREAP